MTSYGSGPINAIHKAIQILCLGWNPIKSFLSEYPQRASCWAQSGNNHKCQISSVSTSKAETRQEHENRHVQPLNQAQKRKKDTEKTFQWLSGRKSNPFPCPARSSQTILRQWKCQSKGLIHHSLTHITLAPQCNFACRVKSGRDFQLSLNLPFYSTNPLESTPWNL